MHGGSGVSAPDYKKSIECGIRKINYYSYMSRAGITGVQDCLKANKAEYFHDLSLAATAAMEKDATAAMKISYRI